MMSDTPKNKDLTEFIAILGILVIIFCIWASYPRILTTMDEPTPPAKVTIPYKLPAVPEQTENTDKSKFENVGEKYGTYGDSYGSLNTLFSGLAFAVLIISLFMQRQELKAQREELAAQRGELTAQRKEAEQSNKIAEGQRKITEQQATLIQQQIDEAKVQNFYFILFKHTENLDTQLNRLRYKAPSGKYFNGEDVLETFASSFTKQIMSPAIQQQQGVELETTSTSILREAYTKTAHQYSFSLLSTLYLENILMILRMIELNKNIVDIKQPILTLSSHLSNNGLLCLAWIAIIKNPELKKYLEQYGLLSQLNTAPKAISDGIKKFINEKAFREI